MTMLADLTTSGASVAQVCHLLQNQQWQSADQVTTELLSGDVSQIACDRLCGLDRAWREASQERFGFSVQRDIWLNLGGQLAYAPNRQWEFAATYLKFSRRVGWLRQNWWRTKWLLPTQLTFSLQAPLGHLPTFCYQRGVDSADAFFWRLTICGAMPP
ncbi:MAG: hypothetical protein HC919_00905 [Oscillatoriales cyanobacterium SM2_2_1]|nr:hypothetical protein [Oscillatoriales cyanobacterium SM2_2_1]